MCLQLTSADKMPLQHHLLPPTPSTVHTLYSFFIIALVIVIVSNKLIQNIDNVHVSIVELARVCLMQV